ncbi:MAG TPA: DinB family protein [Ktedonobacterales bacterium]
MSSPTVSVALSARALLRWQFRLAHQRLDRAIEPFSGETLQRHVPGTTAPVGACYGQIVVCEDVSVNGVLTAGTPLALSTWAGRTGLSELSPLGEPAQWRAWARGVRLDLAALRAYAQAVYAATDHSIAALPDEAFDLTCRDAPACLLSALLLTVSMRHGEITGLLARLPDAV